MDLERIDSTNDDQWVLTLALDECSGEGLRDGVVRFWEVVRDYVLPAGLKVGRSALYVSIWVDTGRAIAFTVKPDSLDRDEPAVIQLIVPSYEDAVRELDARLSEALVTDDEFDTTIKRLESEFAQVLEAHRTSVLGEDASSVPVRYADPDDEPIDLGGVPG